jgi:alpha-L-fucosidase 2
VNREQSGSADLIQRSLDHWQSMPDALRGYSATGASSISSALGKGDAALRYLKGLFDDYLRPNTLYKESGPVIETPLSGAQSVMDMLLQSWGGAIRPFPAVPTTWPDCAFADLSAEGGFLVSGVRADGVTRWLRVTSKAGEPFAILTDIVDPVASISGRLRPLARAENGHLRAPLAKGQTILIRPRGARDVAGIAPIAMAGLPNSFGLNVRNVQRPQRDTALPAEPGPKSR